VLPLCLRLGRACRDDATFYVDPNRIDTRNGSLKTYTEPGGTSGLPLDRRFCPACGSLIVVEVEGSTSTVMMAGTLDGTSFVRPTADIFCESAQCWVPMSTDAKNFPHYDNWIPNPLLSGPVDGVCSFPVIPSTGLPSSRMRGRTPLRWWEGACDTQPHRRDTVDRLP
jgi:hypothetical protein